MRSRSGAPRAAGRLPSTAKIERLFFQVSLGVRGDIEKHYLLKHDSGTCNPHVLAYLAPFDSSNIRQNILGNMFCG